MARIIYGVCGEGMGHAIRSAPVIRHLRKKHKVCVVAYSRAYTYLSKHFDDVHEVEGLHIVYKNNRVMHRSTFLDNLKRVPKMAKAARRYFLLMSRFDPDIVISDFESQTSIFSQILQKPLIQINNINMIDKSRIDYEKKSRDYIIARALNTMLSAGADHFFITTFFYPEKKYSNVEFISPILREEMYDLRPSVGEHLLVYQTSKTNKALVRALKALSVPCIVYGFDRNDRDGLLQFKKFNEVEFFEDLASSRGVVTNGGFTLISEALYLHKPILSIPVEKQFEQMLNAHYLERLEYGMHANKATLPVLRKFLRNISRYEHSLALYKPKHNKFFFKHLDKKISQLLRKYRRKTTVRRIRKRLRKLIFMHRR